MMLLTIGNSFYMGETPEDCVNNAIADGKIEGHWVLMSGDVEFELWELGEMLDLTIIDKEPEYIVKKLPKE